jgi:hypothetical protein
MSQESFSSREEAEWVKRRLKTPWAVKVDLGGIKVINSDGKVVAKMVMETDNDASLASAVIVERVNKM